MTKGANASGAGRLLRLGKAATGVLVFLTSFGLAPGDARAERFVLHSGEVIEGSIVGATRNTVVVRRSIGGMRQMRLRDIVEVRIDLPQGRAAGELLGWTDGVYELGAGVEVIRARRDAIVSRSPRAALAQQTSPVAPSPIAGQREISVTASRVASAGPSGTPSTRSGGGSNHATEATSHAPTSDADVAGSSGPSASSRAVAGVASAAVDDRAALPVGDRASLAIKASVEPPAPGERSMVFKIELSEPAQRAVVLIYGTVDGTAKAGLDYDARQGMVMLAPGDRSAEVHVPLLADQPQDTDKHFELVLMTDPKVAEVVDRRVSATIRRSD